MRFLLAFLLLIPCAAFGQEAPHDMCLEAIQSFSDQGDECHFHRGGITLWEKKDAEDLAQELSAADTSLLTFGESKWVSEMTASGVNAFATGNAKYSESWDWTHQANLKFGEAEALCTAGDHQGAVGKYGWAEGYLLTSYMLLLDADAYYEAAQEAYSESLYYIWWASNSNECLECQAKDAYCSCDPDNPPPVDPDEMEPDPEPEPEPDPETDPETDPEEPVEPEPEPEPEEPETP